MRFFPRRWTSIYTRLRGAVVILPLFRRPDGTSLYRRPDGTSLYRRPRL